MNLSNLITCARLSGQWITCRIGQVSSLASRLRRAFGPCRLPAPVPLPVRVPPLKRWLLVPALMLAVVAVPRADAARSSRFELTSDGRLVDVQVLVGDRATPLYVAPGRWDRRYFQALKGRNYALAITNNTGRRIGVLVAVDGLNVVNGEQSSLQSGEPMYVLDPWQRTVIRGWRSSLQDVRKFVFVDEERSYAERTGQANGDLGWIRVLAFNEARQSIDQPEGGRINGREGDRDGRIPFGAREEAPAPAPEAGRRDQAPPTRALDNNKSYAQEQQGAPSAPGTGWGDRRWDPVQRVWFVPAPSPTDHLVFRYEYASGLRALGIEPGRGRDRIWERERGELGFAQPPRW